MKLYVVVMLIAYFIAGFASGMFCERINHPFVVDPCTHTVVGREGVAV